jgi:hypothetical protein
MANSTAAPCAEHQTPNYYRLPEVPFATFAAEMRWVAVKFIEDEKRSKPVKVPRSPYDGYASVKDPSTWSMLDTIAPTRTLPWSRGVVGFVLTDLPAEQLSAIDLDHVLTADGDFVHDLVREIVEEAVAAGCYIEVTPSSEGLRVLGRVNAQGQRWETTPAPIDPNIPEAGNVELYACPTARYITVTGNTFRPVPNELGDMTELFIRLAQRAGASPGSNAREKDPNVTLPPVGGWDEKVEIDRYRGWLKAEAPLAIEGRGGEKATCDVILTGHDYGLTPDTVFQILT